MSVMYFRLNFEAASDHENHVAPPKFDILKKAFNLGLVYSQSLSIKLGCAVGSVFLAWEWVVPQFVDGESENDFHHPPHSLLDLFSLLLDCPSFSLFFNSN